MIATSQRDENMRRLLETDLVNPDRQGGGV
jgi:hypothetical protein